MTLGVKHDSWRGNEWTQHHRGLQASQSRFPWLPGWWGPFLHAMVGPSHPHVSEGKLQA